MQENSKNSVPVYLKMGENSIVKCGCLGYEDVSKYVASVMKSMAELKKSNSDNFCGFDWDMELQVCPNIRVQNTPIFSKIKLICETPHPEYYNCLSCRARTIKGCFRKIKNRNCKDRFVIENIINVFFADKYKENEEQR